MSYQLHGHFTGRGIVPEAWQSSVGVTMSRLQSNAVPALSVATTGAPAG